jgi:hypothetical protein
MLKHISTRLVRFPFKKCANLNEANWQERRTVPTTVFNGLWGKFNNEKLLLTLEIHL